MNAYVVAIPEMRETHAWMEPPESYLPIGVFAAETRGQAKVDALHDFSGPLSSGVDYPDDWTLLRVRLLARHVRRPRGKYSDADSIWGLIPREWPRMKGA